MLDIHSYPNHRPGYVIAGEDGKGMLLDYKGSRIIARRMGRRIGELGLAAA